MKYTAQDIKDRIRERMPEGSVVADHDAHSHFYIVDGFRYPSVTSKLQILKDESLINYKKNQVIQFVFANHKKFTDANIMEQLALADRVPEDILADASDIGTQIHDTRQRIFEEWIATGVRPGDFLSFANAAGVDVRVTSAVRALQKFCEEIGYTPIATELFVYSHKYKVAGTLDDIGTIPTVVDEGDPECEHKMLFKFGREMCVKCPRRISTDFVLMDLKSSNQFKDHYFFQVAMYWEMLWRLIGIKPSRCFILKLSKEDGTYKIEDLKQPSKLATFAHAMLKTNDAITFIKSLRKDNQKKVAEPINF